MIRIASTLLLITALPALAVDPPVSIARDARVSGVPGAAALIDADTKTTAAIDAGSAVVLEWRQAREIQTIVLNGERLPAAADVSIEWWYRIWPDNGSGGWQKLDDHFNGEWVVARTESFSGERSLYFRMLPLEKQEIGKIKETGARFRRAYKLRIKFKSAAQVEEIEVFNGAVWKLAELNLEWNPHRAGAVWDGEIRGVNASVLSVNKQKNTAAISLQYAKPARPSNTERAILSFHPANGESFAVFVDDVLREGGLYIRDIDAFIANAGAENPPTFANWKGPAGKWDKTILAKVADMPEQSMAAADKAIPAKPTREAHLGVPNMRQEFTITRSGDVLLMAESLRGLGRDLDQRGWPGKDCRYALAAGEKPIFGDNARETRRNLKDGWLPIIESHWSAGPTAVTQSAVATLLAGDIVDAEDKLRGDEPLVLLQQIDLRNTAPDEQAAHLWIDLSIAGDLKLGKDGLLTDGKSTRLRFDTNGRGDLAIVDRAGRQTLRYTVKLPAAGQHAIFLNIPYVHLLDESQTKALLARRYDADAPAVEAYWRKRIDAAMTWESPEPLLNNLFRANLWHILISTDRDPATGLYQHGAATMHYGNFPNETCMVIQSLEMRGEHSEAQRLLEPYLAGQGVKGLPGNFKSREGLFFAAHPTAKGDVYTAQGYNMHHGWILWTLAEHYRWTHDAAWLKSVAPKLIAGCQWIDRERQATKQKNPDGSHVIEWGLAPAGDLEDVEEFLYWYATNAYYWAGMNSTAEVLAQIGDPAAPALKKQADEYRADILASLSAAMAAAPVVKLLDGTWVPYVPQRTDIATHLTEGWIREGLYCALHLADVGLIPPSDRRVSWLLEDLEDNIYLSKDSGYGVADPAANFFHFGGFTLQPALLPNAMLHLKRDETPQFLRSFYNMGSASIFPDTVCFAEWVNKFGSSAGPLYKTTDESKYVQLMRNMLVMEDGRELKLGFGIPRAWMADGKTIRVQRAATIFGPVDLEITSQARNQRITAKLNTPAGADKILLRLRSDDGRPITKITLDDRPWEKFDAAKQIIEVPSGRHTVVASW